MTTFMKPQGGEFVFGDETGMDPLLERLSEEHGYAKELLTGQTEMGAIIRVFSLSSCPPPRLPENTDTATTVAALGFQRAVYRQNHRFGVQLLDESAGTETFAAVSSLPEAGKVTSYGKFGTDVRFNGPDHTPHILHVSLSTDDHHRIDGEIIHLPGTVEP